MMKHFSVSQFVIYSTSSTFCLMMVYIFPELPGIVKSYLVGAWMNLAFCTLDDRVFRYYLWRNGIYFRRNWNKPYLSKSVAEYWSWRWNYLTAAYLRDIVYTPIVEGKLVASRKSYKDIK